MSDDNVQICLVTGSSLLCDEVIDKISSSLGDCEISYVDESDNASDVYSKMYFKDIFSEHEDRLMIFKGKKLPKADKSDFWLETFKSLPKDLVVVLKNIKLRKNSKLYKYIKKEGKVFSFDDKVSISRAEGWLKKKLNTLNKGINSDAKEYLMNNISSVDGEVDLDRLDNVLSSLVNVSPKGDIELLDVQKVVSPKEEDIWSFFEYLDSKDVKNALSFVSLKLDKSSNVSGDINGMLSVSFWRYRLINFIKSSKLHKRDTKDIIKKVKGWTKIDKDGSGEDTVLKEKLTKSGKSTPIYSDAFVKNVIFRDSGKLLDQYPIQRIMKSIIIIEEFLYVARAVTEETELRLLADLFVLVMCDKISPSVISNYKEFANEKLQLTQ